MPHPYNLHNIRALLTDGFSAEQLRTFCYDEAKFRPVYHQFGNDPGKTKMIGQIIEFADQYLLFEILLAWAKTENPAQFEAHQPYGGAPEEDFSAIRQAYVEYLVRRYKDHVIRGFSPRVSGRDVSLPLAKIFLPLQAIEGRPALAEYAEEDLFRQAAGLSLDKSAWQQHSLEMEKRSAQLRVRQAAQRPLTLAELLDSSRAVLLGDPGTGKTTVTHYVTYALAADEYIHLGESVRGLTPVLVRLANYGKAFEHDRTMHLIEYIEQELMPKPEFGRYLRQAIEAGQCLIVLDGLDEVTDPGLRLRVTERIQAMVASHNRNRFLVTSRIVGYDRSPLTREFKHATLKELGPEDKVRFVNLWYDALQAELSSHPGEDGAADLVKTLQTIPQISRLAANPLLLTIMVLMHWRGVKLPNRRVEIYQNATDTLIEYWTTHREGVDLDAYEIKSILAPIAHYILSSGVGGVIAHHDLLPRFHQGIATQRGCDLPTARRLGRDLLRMLGEQSGIFLERGLDANSQPVYGFLHQTFGEYLAALHLADEVLSDTFQIETYIHQAMWHEPFLLLAGHLSLVSQTHLGLLVRQILDHPSPYEDQLQRNVLLAADFLADDIQVKTPLRDEVLLKLAELLQHKAPQVREAAAAHYRRLALTRHREAATAALKTTLAQIQSIDKLSAKVRFDIAQALIHLDERAEAKPFLWPLDHETYGAEIRRDKVQRLRFEGWPDQAADYLCRLHADINQGFYIRPAINLSSFILGSIDAASARQVLGETVMLKTIETLRNQAKDKIEQANLHLLAALVPHLPNLMDLAKLLVLETPAETRCLAAIRLLDTDYRAEAINILQDLVATEPEQAPKAAQALLKINDTISLAWQLLYDTAFIGDDDNAPQAIITLLQAGNLAIALPAALHLLSLYPPRTISDREVRLWPVVEAFLKHNQTTLGLRAARWLALRPGYSYRLQACEALLEAGQVKVAIPLLQYLAYECHDESSQQACQRLLLLKEAERLVPLLAQLSASDVADKCYHACSALALVNHPPHTCQAAAWPRHNLKIAIYEERTSAYQEALRNFCEAGFEALDAIESTGDFDQACHTIARLALLTLSEAGVPADPADTIGELLNSSWPVVVVNAALFELRSGRFERAHGYLVNLLSQTGQTLSLPVHQKALTTLGQIVSPETTAVLVQALEHPHSRIRLQAVQALGPLGDSAAAHSLITSLNDQDKDVRSGAARALGELGDLVATQPLIEALNHEDSELRSSAASALGRLGSPVAVQPLIRALNDEAALVRGGAAIALGRLGQPEALSPLLSLLEDDSAQVRCLAAYALGQLGGASVIPHLITNLNDPSSMVRRLTILALDYIGDQAVIPPLLTLLSDENSEIRDYAAETLSHFHNVPKVVGTMLESIVDKNDNIRIPAAIFLGGQGNSIAIPILIEALNNESGLRRRSAAQALGNLCDYPEIHQSLLTSLSDESPPVRSNVVWGLGDSGISAVVPSLVITLEDDDFFVRRAATKALGKMGNSAIYKTLLVAHFGINISERQALAEALGYLNLNNLASLLAATANAYQGFEAISYGTALVHLDPVQAVPVLERYISQFRQESGIKWILGQARWELGDLEAALTYFKEAYEQKSKSIYQLALAHFYLEHDDLPLAYEYVEQALKHMYPRQDKYLCLSSQAVIQWLMSERQASIRLLQQAKAQNPLNTRPKVLQYQYFWREKAISALTEMLAQQESATTA